MQNEPDQNRKRTPTSCLRHSADAYRPTKPDPNFKMNWTPRPKLQKQTNNARALPSLLALTVSSQRSQSVQNYYYFFSQPGATAPLRDKVVIVGDGNAKGKALLDTFTLYTQWWLL